MSNAAMNIAEAIQTASINRAPSPRHDLNPSTAASAKEPVTVSAPPVDSDLDDDEIPDSVIQPQARKANLPPLPDLRFEQSYLASISKAETKTQVMWITVRDQVILPLVQGTMWTLILHGWRFWNKSASYSGRTIGSRIRLWWYGVNNWDIPKAKPPPRLRLANDIGEYYTGIFGSSGVD
ncbi:MAG: hypothetical protein M1838_001507 [Thelocarpon superellum]|nr:MAG: hypothetical protein M1838_001507 [Thelocarpon superellum]